jgi:UDP-glucose 4-epimerase
VRVLVSGGAGFIGSAVVLRLKEQGHEPVVFDRFQGQDIVDSGAVADAVKGCDAVIHLAGMLGTHELFDIAHMAVNVNIHGTLNVLQACDAFEASYVGITMPVSGWANVYTATKHCAQDLASAWHRHKGLKVSHVRAYNAYGPGQKCGPGHPQKIVPTFATEAWAGRPIPIWGDGEQTVDLIHVDDLARHLVDALAYEDDRIIEGGSGEPFTVNHIAALVQIVTGGASNDVEHLPMRMGEDAGTNIVSPVKNAPFDMARFRETVESYRP